MDFCSTTESQSLRHLWCLSQNTERFLQCTFNTYVVLKGLTPSPDTKSLGYPFLGKGTTISYCDSNKARIPKYWYLDYIWNIPAVHFQLFRFSWTIWLYKLTLIPQVTLFWEKVLDKDAKERLVSNIAGHLKDAKEFLQQRAVSIHLWKTNHKSSFLEEYNFSDALSNVSVLGTWKLGRHVKIKKDGNEETEKLFPVLSLHFSTSNQ